VRVGVRLAAGLSLGLAAVASAAPDLSAPRQFGSLRVYPDFRDEHLYYLGPGDLEVAIDENGRPKLHFLQLRYTGTALYGNQGESGSFSTLTLGVRQVEPAQEELLLLRKSLRRIANVGRVELRPLPITAFEAVLAYAPIGETSELRVVDDGYFESEDKEEARSDQRAFWSERTFTIPMNEATSQLFWDLLQRQELAISINYAFFSRGVFSNELATVDISASEQQVEKDLLEGLRAAGVPLAPRREPTGVAARLLERLRAERSGEKETPEKEQSGPPERTQLVHGGATAIRVDLQRWPELFQRVDFNDRAPPGYAVIKVYCYDFANARRPDLFYKKVEIEAEGVGGRPVPIDAKFLSSQPDLYARTLRFPVAVQVDRPFRYRVTSAARDGHVETGPWVERATWGPILDITSAPGEGPGDEREVEG